LHPDDILLFTLMFSEMSAKGIPECYDILIISSRHVEAVILLQRL